MKRAFPLDGATILWSAPSDPIARGRGPTVSMNNAGQFVLIYFNSIWTPQPELRARVGQLTNGVVTIYDEFKFDTGSFPSVGINDNGQVVSTHQQNNGGLSLYYNTGVINGNKIDWNQGGVGTFYTTGQETSVDLNNDGLLVEVHKANVSESMWSLVGRLEGDGIFWTQGSTQFDSGRKPNVALNNNNAIAQFHETTKFFPGRIFNNAGKIDDGLKVRWFGSHESDGFLSASPKVDMNDSGLSVQVHASTNGGMYYRIGTLIDDDRLILENDAVQFLQAFEYDVTINNNGQVLLVYTNEDTTKAENLRYITGQIII